MTFSISLALWGLLLFVKAALSIPSVYTSGTKFFLRDGDDTQFFIKGVVYQPGSVNDLDPLSNTAQCEADVIQMKALGVNTVSVYTANATNDHDGCMGAFEDAGIYVLLGLSSPLHSVNRADPEWTLDLYEKYTAVLDVFAGYDNLLGFYSGNEVINSLSTANSAPVVKALTYDLKRYLVSRGHRQIPIGYGEADDNETRQLLTQYLACSSPGLVEEEGYLSTQVDFVSFNRYSWCGDSSMEEAGYDKLLAENGNHILPVFFGETGCNTVVRTFSDQKAILGPDMNGRFSGAIIYQWAETENNYGLVSYVLTNTVSTPVPKATEFNNLRSQWSTLTPDGSETTWSTPQNPIPTCPGFTSGTKGWPLSASALLPTLGVKQFSGRPTVITSSTSTGTGLPKLATPGGSLSSDSSSTSSSHPSTKPLNSADNPKGSGNSGTTIGIGVGVGIGALALLSLLVWFLMRRRKQKKMSVLDPAGLEVSGVDTFPAKPELDGFSAGVVGLRNKWRKQTAVVELDSDTVKEKSYNDSTLPVIELPSNEVSSTVETGAATTETIGRKPIQPQTSSSNMNSSNTPWFDEGREEFTPTQSEVKEVQVQRSAAASALAQAQSSNTADQREIERLEEEERRLDREIVEFERLRKLQDERTRVRKLLEEKRGGQSSGA